MSEKKTVTVPFFKPSLTSSDEEAVLRVMRSGWLTTGNETRLFEEEFARFVSCPHALAVNSATSGLMLAMQALGVGPGTRILTTPYTFVSTATAAIHLGAEVMYADIERDGFNIDPEEVEKALLHNRDIRAVVPVHIAGLPCDMTRICSAAHKSDVSVIEDAAHAFPSKTENGYAGTIADAGVFSFYATKTITTGEGGMVCVNDDALARHISRLRCHGIDRPVWDRYTSSKAEWMYDVIEEGWKCNLPDILSAIGREQLKRAPSFFEKRRKIAQRYSEAFAPYDFLSIPPDGDGHAWHLYLLGIVPERMKCDRDHFGRALRDAGLGISMHFIPHFELTWCKNRYGLSRTDFPNAARRYDTTITLPLWPDMTEQMIAHVIDTVISVGKENSRRIHC